MTPVNCLFVFSNDLSHFNGSRHWILCLIAGNRGMKIASRDKIRHKIHFFKADLPILNIQFSTIDFVPKWNVKCLCNKLVIIEDCWILRAIYFNYFIEFENLGNFLKQQASNLKLIWDFTCLWPLYIFTWM